MKPRISRFSSAVVREYSSTPITAMSSYDDTKNAAAQKSEETKNYGQQKAGEAQDATKVPIFEQLCLRMIIQ